MLAKDTHSRLFAGLQVTKKKRFLCGHQDWGEVEGDEGNLVTRLHQREAQNFDANHP
jgi:hypothetical protein